MVHLWLPNRRLATPHSGRLERMIGPDQAAALSAAMREWYGPPIPVSYPGSGIWAYPGGEFAGMIGGGAGFSSLSDLIAEATAGKRREFFYQKVGSTGVSGVTNSLLQLGSTPPAAPNAAAAPGGEAPVDSDVGFFSFVNPVNGDTQHWVSGFPLATVAGNTLLLFDCLFRVNKTMASAAVEAVTGVPTRYQSTTPGAPDSAEGNFLFVQVGLTALANTAHAWTVCTYKNQADGDSTLPSLTGNNSAIVHRLDHPVAQWFAPLAVGDRGVKALTQMQCSASVASGVINFVIGHPIAWMPCPLASMMCIVDGINTEFNLARIFDDAALAFLEVQKPATTATTYSGQFTTVAG